MAQIMFALRGSASRSGSLDWASHLATFRSTVEREYYQSSATVEMPEGDGEIRIDRTAAGGISVLRYSSSSYTQVDRNWKHIRADGSQFFVVWFLVEGKLWITQKDRTAAVEPGSFAISSSAIPFRISSMPDSAGKHISYQILVPHHAIAQHAKALHQACAHPLLLTAAARLALGMFDGLLETGAEIPPELAGRIAQAALDTVLSAVPSIASHGHLDPASQDRMAAIKGCIEKNIGVPGLTAPQVAAACGISVSYMYKLLALEGLQFSDYLWGARLERARLILASGSTASISEVARMVGFKSTAHFSRAFRSRFGVSPSCSKTAG
jgi:AraC family transcriptional regulator, positive regulator of tynA and feaB